MKTTKKQLKSHRNHLTGTNGGWCKFTTAILNGQFVFLTFRTRIKTQITYASEFNLISKVIWSMTTFMVKMKTYKSTSSLPPFLTKLKFWFKETLTIVETQNLLKSSNWGLWESKRSFSTIRTSTSQLTTSWFTLFALNDSLKTCSNLCRRRCLRKQSKSTKLIKANFHKALKMTRCSTQTPILKKSKMRSLTKARSAIGVSSNKWASFKELLGWPCSKELHQTQFQRNIKLQLSTNLWSVFRQCSKTWKLLWSSLIASKELGGSQWLSNIFTTIGTNLLTKDLKKMNVFSGHFKWGWFRNHT